MNKRTAIPFLILLISFSVIFLRPAYGQGENIEIKYGETVQGSITATNYSAVYGFIGKQGDVVSITVTRASGNLKPVVGLFDPSLPKDKMMLTAGVPSSDGKTATISDYPLPKAGVYGILVSRASLDKGTTTGGFKLTLTNSKSGPKQPTPGSKSGKTTPTPARGATGSEDALEAFSVGQMPTCILWNGELLYVCNSLDSTISVLDQDGSSVGTIKVGDSPLALAWDGARLWVSALPAADPANAVYVFDAKGKKVGTYAVGGEAHSLSFDEDNQQMWIAVWSEKQIISMSLKGKILATVETDSQPEAVWWTGTQLWATLAGTSKSWNNQIISVDGDANIMDTFTVGKAPLNLAWNADDGIVYVSNYASNTVTALDADGQVIGTYKVGSKPTGLVWDGEHLWVALTGDKAVVALDSDGKIIAKIPFDNSPERLAGDGENIWVTNAGSYDNPGNTVTRINIEKALSAAE